MAKVFKKDGAGRSYCVSCKGYVHPSKSTRGGSTTYIKADFDGPIDPIIPYRQKGYDSYSCPECNGSVSDPYINSKYAAFEKDRAKWTGSAKRGSKLITWGFALFAAGFVPILFLTNGFENDTIDAIPPPFSQLVAILCLTGLFLIALGLFFWLAGKLGGA
tara:strand:- start:404 stop:886 length:483 start_codon:yes stop_codon:yes gene_type:complete